MKSNPLAGLKGTSFHCDKLIEVISNPFFLIVLRVNKERSL